MDHEVHYVAMDNGSAGEKSAGARFPTGEHNRTWNVAQASFKAYVILPHDPQLLDARIACLKDLASALSVRFGAIAFEPTYEYAHAFVLAHGSPSAPLSDRRRAERRAHGLYADQVRSNIPGPEWGLFLTEEHLERVSLTTLKRVFARVEPVREGLVYLQLTATPDDLPDRAAFDAALDNARSALQPILMDLSSVTFPP
jgi:hypothetical protein